MSFKSARRFLFFLFVTAGLACREGDSDEIVVSGHVEATEVRVSTKVGGTVESIDFDEGDSVTRGQELARIDTVDLRLTLEAIRSDRALAEAELDAAGLRYRVAIDAA